MEVKVFKDHDLGGINDPKPSCRKMMSGKSKKKKEKGSDLVRSNDEIIESGVYKNSVDDYDSEAYFSKDLI